MLGLIHIRGRCVHNRSRPRPLEIDLNSSASFETRSGPFKTHSHSLKISFASFGIHQVAPPSRGIAEMRCR